MAKHRTSERLNDGEPLGARRRNGLRTVRRRRVASASSDERIEAGTIYVNEYRTISYRTPFGGYKDSGLGRELGTEGLEEYYQTKSVWIDLAGVVEDPFTMG